MVDQQQNYDITLLKQGHENLRQSLHKAFNAIDQLGRQVYELEIKIQNLNAKLTKIEPQSQR